MNKKAAGWAAILGCITVCALTYGVAIRPVIKRRKTESFQSEAAFLFKKMQEKQQLAIADTAAAAGGTGFKESA